MKFISFLLFFFVINATCSQINVNYTVNTGKDRHTISPYIYGVNHSDYRYAKAIRKGGNRLTGYNWENNASNAGTDWHNNSDNYLASTMGISQAEKDSAGLVLSRFVEKANAFNQYILVTLPMAGYVAADKNGEVTESETAPSSRWKKVIFNKPAELSLAPDKSDDFVYVDEEINFLVNKHGDAETSNGINGYELDNEPALWSSTHPRIHKAQPTISELLSQSIELSKTIKGADETASVFGPVLYGFSAFMNFQKAPDWDNYSANYDWFISVYLDEMKKASQKAGRRLLDVLDIHWYPSPKGVFSGDTSQAVSEERMQCLRSLYDSSYKENSWIGKWFGPVALIPHLQYSINKYYPDTKIAITEYDYGADNHISGAIAEAKALGIFGKYDIFLAARWNGFKYFIKSVFDLYLNYDNKGASFGSLSVAAESSDTSSAIFAALDDENSTTAHLIITNDNYDEEINGTITIDSKTSYKNASVYAIHRNNSKVIKLDNIDIANNKMNITLPPLSVCHFVLNPEPSSVNANDKATHIVLSPNPATDYIDIVITGDRTLKDVVEVYDVLGNVVLTLTPALSLKGEGVKVDVSSLAAGVYFIRLGDKMYKFVKI